MNESNWQNFDVLEFLQSEATHPRRYKEALERSPNPLATLNLSCSVKHHIQKQAFDNCRHHPLNLTPMVQYVVENPGQNKRETKYNDVSVSRPTASPSTLREMVVCLVSRQSQRIVYGESVRVD